MTPKNDAMNEMKELFEGAWEVRGMPNVTRKNADWKGVCYDFYLLGAVMATKKLEKAGGKE